MKRYTITTFHLLMIYLILNPVHVDAQSMLGWFWSKQEESSSVIISDGVPLLDIPYETLTEDEKFLKEAAKLVTDIQVSSPLEMCQHKVVLKIKTSCGSMTEEQLAKMSVNLLNCQSQTEGRKVFPCSENMTIKQCTMNMDPDMWNAYHLMSNRARAVCYATRSHQFRALTELTVNKLMQSARSQIETLAAMKESQDRLEEQTANAHQIIESNIKDLTNEKALIRAGHSQLAAMAEDIKKKLEKASQDLMNQSEERGKNHQEILEDLENIQTHAQFLWEKIESSTNRIIEQNYEAAQQYEETLEKLEKINQTIVFVYELTNNMKAEIDRKLGWITEYIGTTGESIERAYRVTLHVFYLIGAMIVAAFLHAPFLTRSAILGIIPLNLVSYMKHGYNACLDFVSLTLLILLITAMHYVMNAVQYIVRTKLQKHEETAEKCEKSDVLSKEQKLTKKQSVMKTLVNPPKRGQSLLSRIAQSLKNSRDHIYKRISETIDHIRQSYLSAKAWVRQRMSSTEELSCSYLPARKYHERIVSGRSYPSISEDSSDHSDSRESGEFVYIDDHTPTGAVLRRNIAEKRATSATGFYEGGRKPLRESMLRETMHLLPPRKGSSRSVTPVTKPACGAKTRSGNPCRLLALRDQKFCHKHTSGSSDVGD
ncbi:hypothetical protein QAD02_023782 [Eretmocerus hayati]|uniref:Uncharacterized protein n=1 Tax=Eretmocerus hayati TaxID=131215 RepID=A0ACC2Q086_9HYME|nr:hypothetical protein QAD02_023782 [Eretmocerus hayati]